MNRELANEELKDVEQIRSFVNMSTQSCKFHRPEVTTRLLKLRKTLKRARQEAETVFRESNSL